MSGPHIIVQLDFPFSILNLIKMELIRQTFAECKQNKRAALVAYITAGFPTVEESIDAMLGLENGGAGMVSLSLSLSFAWILMN